MPAPGIGGAPAMKTQYNDCYMEYNGIRLVIGNSKIRRSFRMDSGYPQAEEIRNVKTGYNWVNSIQPVAAFSIGSPWTELPVIQIQTAVDNRHHMSENHLSVNVSFTKAHESVRWNFRIYPCMPFITTELYLRLNEQQIEPEKGCPMQLPGNDTIEAFNIKERHVKMEVLQYADETDYEDTLIRSIPQRHYWYEKKAYLGNGYLFDAYLSGEQLFLQKESLLPRWWDEEGPQLCTDGNLLQMCGSGTMGCELPADEEIPCYGCTIGVGSGDDLKRAYASYYRQEYSGYKKKIPYIMSNTWGDRNQDTALSEEFILQELETASQIGVDVLQIDDGWQKGITINSKLKTGGVWEGYYEFDPDFWNINPMKFPHGFLCIAERAAAKHVKLGLWFSPDSSHDFKNWEKDVETLVELYRNYGICFFKMDGIKIRNKYCEIQLMKLLSSVMEKTDYQVEFNFDVTAERRLGYLYQKQIGTIFVENRYTDWGTYYPYDTLRNLWQLAGIFPTRKLQMEFLNPRRQAQKYGDDKLAPCHYKIDYLFAVTMMANPLAWMEISRLDAGSAELLTRVIHVYKKIRKALFDAEVIPIGAEPDGVSLTGFWAKVNEHSGYFLLFRDCGDSAVFEESLEELREKMVTPVVLYAGTPLETAPKLTPDGTLTVHLPEKRSFVLLSYQESVENKNRKMEDWQK